MDYWIENSKYDIPNICPCCKGSITNGGCTIGAHLVKYGNKSGEVYIIPTCKSCNSTYKNGEEGNHPFYILEDMFVPANTNNLYKKIGV